MLLHIEKVLTPAQVQECRLQLNRCEWQDGKMTAGGVAGLVKANQQLDDALPVAQALRSALLDILRGNPLFVSAALPHKIFPPKFNRYTGGGHYGLHVDGAVMTLPEGEMMRTDLSATLFLTDPDDYDGGELVIETQYGAQEVKLDAGDMVLYPSSSLHQVTPVTRGARVSSFFWVQSLVQETRHREHLFDLDQTIQALTAERGAQDEQVKNLTRLYHNLVRDWAKP
ncbi:Fe2+-dependent dioxygenase [Aestuariicella hydrocarbonica]|uniref:Fe2+-dependent dioxygenase n=1 Tax=Pseudomaricurvus hydrocarbonicus TaxID=1470433 RepID=A0A9E5JT69_9GAMM|nr:Fe2+-dependent dioxygenase [Aestuariicella hydrocarbonica]NHO64864.1 Fe2+-dependent dioxygenase [Aestuariicella hydrocarbonica]